jgi:CBS domain containing-hemolysin-like protein
MIDASASLRDLVTQLRWKFPREPGVETLAGFLLTQLGHIPEVGEHIDFGGRRYFIAEMKGQRIARVRIEELDDPGNLPAKKGTARELAGGKR